MYLVCTSESVFTRATLCSARPLHVLSSSVAAHPKRKRNLVVTTAHSENEKKSLVCEYLSLSGTPKIEIALEIQYQSGVASFPELTLKFNLILKNHLL